MRTALHAVLDVQDGDDDEGGRGLVPPEKAPGGLLREVPVGAARATDGVFQPGGKCVRTMI